MKSISDILNSMVQPADQNPLFGSNQGFASQGNSSVGSFGDVLSRLTAQNQSSAQANTNGSTVNAQPTTNNNTASTGVSFSDITITEVDVKETVETTDPNSAALKSLETTVASMASALTQLVQLASQLQNLNPTQAQNLLVQAGGGAISAAQAQQLVAQLTAFKNQQMQQGGQDPLNLTAAQQGTLVAQLMQNMLQNQQITVTPAAGSQSGQAVNGNSQNASSLQFDFNDNKNGENNGATVESLSVNVETLNLEIANSAQSATATAAQGQQLTDATTQRLTQLLQQLNVTPATQPVNVQVQSSVASLNSSDLAKNFENLVHILTQAGAGQVVLSNYVAKNQNANSPSTQQSTTVQNLAAQTVASNLPQAVSAPALAASTTETGLSSAALNVTSNPLTAQVVQNDAVNQNFETTNVQLQVQPAAGAPTNVNAPQVPVSNISSSVALNPVAPALAPQSPQPVNAPSADLILLQAPQNTVQSQPVTQQPTDGPLNGQLLQAPTSSQSTLSIQAPVNQPVVDSLVQPIRPVSNAQTTTTTNLSSENASPAPANTTSTLAETQSVTSTTNAQTITPNAVQALAQSSGASATNNQQPQASSPVVITPVPVPVVDNQAQTNAPIAQNPVVSTVGSVPQSQTVLNNISADKISAPTASITPTQQTTNATNDIITATYVDAQVPQDQGQLVLSNGQLDALNTIVARFNSGILQAGPTGPNTNTLKGNTQVYETITGQKGIVPQAVAPVTTAQAVTPVTPTLSSVVTNAVAQQNTQATNSNTQNNIQAQASQSTSPVQQPVNDLNVSDQNAFVRAGANTTATGTPNTTIVNTTPITAPIAEQSVNTNSTPAQQPVEQVTNTNGSTNQVALPTTASANPVEANVQAPVVTQPVVNPTSVTTQNVPAATVAGEVVKAAVAPAPANAPVVNNASVVAEVSATQAVQPVTAQAVTQTPLSTESQTALNAAPNGPKDTLASTTDLQNLTAAINPGVTQTSNKQSNEFQNTVNSVSTPNGSVTSAQILNQITQQVAAQANDAKMVSRLNFELVPQSLGRVTVQVALVDQSVSARIMVTNADVKEVLQQHMVDLKAALSQAGLQIDQMQVQVQGGGANLLAQYYQYQQEGGSYRGSAFTPDSSAAQAQTTDNSMVSTPVASNRLVNILA